MWGLGWQGKDKGWGSGARVQFLLVLVPQHRALEDGRLVAFLLFAHVPQCWV